MKNISYDLTGTLREFWLTHVRGLKYSIKHVLPNTRGLSRTRQLQNSRKGKKAFVLANGPSLQKLDLTKMREQQKQGFDVWAMNSYISSPVARELPPDYYVISDPAYWGNYDNNPNLTPQLISEFKTDLKILNDLEIPVFIPIHYAKKQILKNAYPFHDYENFFTRNIHPCKPRGYTSMTAFKTLALACFMGYEEIYIAGFDNDYFKSLAVDENNQAFFMDRHFYDTGVKFIADAQSGQGMGDLLWDYHLLFKHLDRFDAHRIFNLDPQGLVDRFPKKIPMDLLKPQRYENELGSKND